MNGSFIHDKFLLENKYAEELYHDYSKKLPIIDYYYHLPPQQIAEDKTFNSITDVWINGDHYKWHAMRTLYIDDLRGTLAFLKGQLCNVSMPSSRTSKRHTTGQPLPCCSTCLSPIWNRSK